MKISTIALVFGSALVVAGAGVGLAACSSDSGTGNPTTGTDSGGTHDSSSGTDSSSNQDSATQPDSDPGDAGPGTDCGTTPTLHASDGGPGSIYCPFGPDGGPIHCSAGSNELCCINPKVGGNYPASTCSSTCPYADAGGATNIQCQDSITCSANGKGSICCGSGPAPAPLMGCGYDEEKGLKGGTCEQGPSCASGEFQLCGAQSECPTGKTCTPFKAKGMQLGYCK